MKPVPEKGPEEVGLKVIVIGIDANGPIVFGAPEKLKGPVFWYVTPE